MLWHHCAVIFARENFYFSKSLFRLRDYVRACVMSAAFLHLSTLDGWLCAGDVAECDLSFLRSSKVKLGQHMLLSGCDALKLRMKIKTLSLLWIWLWGWAAYLGSSSERHFHLSTSCAERCTKRLNYIERLRKPTLSYLSRSRSL